MTFGDKMKDLLGKGLEASKTIAVKAGAKAQDLGEKGVLKLEIRQLEGQAQKAISRLGAEIYSLFTEKGAVSVSSSDPEIKELLAELATIKESVEKRESELREDKKTR
jgi:hypothetical protein